MAKSFSKQTINGTDYIVNDPNIAPVFLPSVAYSAGEFVKHEGVLYRFTADHPAGAFVQTDCVQVDIGDELSSLKSAINVLEDDVEGLESSLAEKLNKPSGTGSIGQVPRIGSNSMEWSSVGQPTDAQVNEAVSDWLDEHPEATTTVDFSIAIKVFPTVADMIADETLKNGDNVATRGYYSWRDNGGTNYAISENHVGIFYIELNNGLYANLLTERGLLRAESVGIKAYTASTENPDTDDMDNNVLLFNKAIYNGIYLIFGTGWFYFSSAVQLAHKNTYTIRGTARESTHLIFPNSDGLYFSDPIYYNHYVIRGMHIHSYGNTIGCAPHCLTVLDSHFEWLMLESETGNGFEAPSYNVAKYTSQGGSTIYDTCVQNCVFDFVNVNAPQGAGFCNIMGMYNYYTHLNFVSCKYAFRNCDGTVEQANNLGTQQDYYIYYDKTNSHSLRWLFINVNAEGLAKAFMYTEPQQSAGTGEDSRKPETANIMTIERFTAINSDWSLYGVSSGHTYYPITVQRINRIDLINSDRLIAPSVYPSVYDTSAVIGEIHLLENSTINVYKGGKTIKCKVGSGASPVIYYGDGTRSTILTDNMHVGEDNTKVPSKNDVFYAQRLYGGKEQQIWYKEISSYSGNAISMNDSYVPYNYIFLDTILFKITATYSGNYIDLASVNLRYCTEGKIITIKNLSSSTKPIHIMNRYVVGNWCFDLQLGDLIINQNESAQFILRKVTINGSKYNMWVELPTGKEVQPIKYSADSGRYETQVIRSLLKDKLNIDLIFLTKGYYLKTNGATVDLTDLTPSTTGFGYAIVPCSAGDVFVINGTGAKTTRLWAFLDASNNVLSVANEDTTGVDLEITAPANTAKLVINSKTNGACYKKL